MEDESQEKTGNFYVKDLIRKINVFLGDEKPADILIIKANLLCEYYINHILILKETCSAKEIESLDFSDKIQKAFVLENPSEKKIFDYVHRLNKLRNKVGHELEYALSESDVDTLGYVQGKEYILNKYESKKDVERLRDILVSIVIEIALLLTNAVQKEKKKVKTLPEIK